MPVDRRLRPLHLRAIAMRLMLSTRVILASLAAPLLACGGDDGGRGGPVGATSPVGTTAVDEPGTDTMIKLDVGGADGSSTMGMAEDGDNESSCERVDVLIAVDNSSSMQEEIDALRGPVFDSFPAVLLDVGNGLLDFQLGVIDACNVPAALHNQGAEGPCNFSTGTNYMISSSPGLAAEYSCVTDLTSDGFVGMPDGCTGQDDDEQPANTAADALADLGGLNAGFVRDDAVLLVVAMTDEDEKPLPAQTAQQIVDKIVAAKGDINNVVFLGVGGSTLCQGPYGTATPANTLQEVANIFAASGRGVFWDLCDGDLTQAFESAIEVVDSACDEFGPEG